jgi:hypothetical protein
MTRASASSALAIFDDLSLGDAQRTQPRRDLDSRIQKPERVTGALAHARPGRESGDFRDRRA